MAGGLASVRTRQRPTDRPDLPATGLMEEEKEGPALSEKFKVFQNQNRDPFPHAENFEMERIPPRFLR